VYKNSIVSGVILTIIYFSTLHLVQALFRLESEFKSQANKKDDISVFPSIQELDKIRTLLPIAIANFDTSLGIEQDGIGKFIWVTNSNYKLDVFHNEDFSKSYNLQISLKKPPCINSTNVKIQVGEDHKTISISDSKTNIIDIPINLNAWEQTEIAFKILTETCKVQGDSRNLALQVYLEILYFPNN
jgi:hypothetical protein